MFRDLKEYQEIAKIYAEKVSKPENLEERRGSSSEQLTQNRTDAFSSKPNTSTYQSNRDKLNKQRTELNKGRAEKQFSVLKAKPGSQGRVSRSSQNMSGKPKPMPTTAEIRAKNAASGGSEMSNIPSKEGNAVIDGKKINPDFGKKVEIKKVEIKKEPVRKMNPIEKKNRERLGNARVDALKAKNKDFQAMKKGGMSKDDFIKKYPKSITAKKAAMEEFTPYDIVLEYLLSTEQVATIEEANYVMTEMDAETIQGIVEEQKKTLTEKPDDGYIGPKFLGIKNPMNKARKDYQMDYKLKKLSGTGDSPETRDMLNIPRDYKITPEQKAKYGFK